MNKKDKAMARKLLKSIYMPDSEIENEIKNNTLSEIVQLVFYVRLGAAFLVGARYLIALDAKKEKPPKNPKRKRLAYKHTRNIKRQRKTEYINYA